MATEYTLQNYFNTQLIGLNNQTLQAGGSTLTFDKTAQNATFKDPEGNETVFDATSTTPTYYVSFEAEGPYFQKHYLRIFEKNPIVVRIQLVDPTEALY